MLFKIVLKLYICLIYIVLSVTEGVNNITLVPSQILLPQTTYYISPRTKDSIKINVEFLLRVEPRLCVNWELQNTGILQLLPQTEDDNYLDNINTSDILNRCYNSIRIRTLSNNVLSESMRTWIFAYYNVSKLKASTEVVISPMASIQFETRNRRISVDQIVTLKIIGHDRYNNTFTSLEGIPFEAKIENNDIMEIVDLRNDPDVATIGRISLLDKSSFFDTTKGYVLVSDVIILQGKNVGKTKISLRVMLPQYKDIILNDVEFTVSDSVVLDPSRIILSPGTKFKFCLTYLQTPNDVVTKINYNNYLWSVDPDAKSVLISGGLLSLPSTEQNFNVHLRDKRNDEVFTSNVSVKTPYSLNLSYDNVSNSQKCFTSKGINIDFKNSYPLYFENVYNHLYDNCLGSIHCGKFINSDHPTLYLLEKKVYILDLSLKDKDGLNIYITSDILFSWNVTDNKLIKINWKSANGRMILVETINVGMIDMTVSLNSIKMNIKIVITTPVELVDYPLSVLNNELMDTVDYNMSMKPMILPINESIKLRVAGGSGEYDFKVDGNIIVVNFGQLMTKDYGSCILTIVDKLDIGNVYKIQVIVSKISEVRVNDLNIERDNIIFTEVLCFSNLVGIKPVFTEKLDYNQFYFCPNVFNPKSKYGGDVVSYDKSYLELVKVTNEPGLMLYFRGNEIGKGNVSIRFYEDSIQVMTTFLFTVYEPLTISIDLLFTHLPLKYVPLPIRSTKQDVKILFANIPVGGNTRIVVTGGPPDRRSLTVTTTNNMLYIERVDENVYDLYCMDIFDDGKFNINVDNISKEFNVSCKIPHYIEIYPLTLTSDINEDDVLMKLHNDPSIKFLPEKIWLHLRTNGILLQMLINGIYFMHYHLMNMVCHYCPLIIGNLDGSCQRIPMRKG